MVSEGSSVVPVCWVEGTVQPAGCSTTARVQEDGPVIWEALSVLHEQSWEVALSEGNRSLGRSGAGSRRAE